MVAQHTHVLLTCRSVAGWQTKQLTGTKKTTAGQLACIVAGAKWRRCWVESFVDLVMMNLPRDVHVGSTPTATLLYQSTVITLSLFTTHHTHVHTVLYLLHYSTKLLNQWNCCRLDIGSMGTFWTIYMYNDAAFNAPNINAGLQCIYVKLLLSWTSSIYWQ